LKVVLVNRYFFPDESATSQLLSDVAFFLAEAHWDVHVVTSRQRYGDALAELPLWESCREVKIHRVWTSRFGRRFLLGRVLDYATFYLAAAWVLMKALKAGDVVVAKTDPPLLSVIAAITARLRAASLVNWWQDVFPETAVALQIRGIRGWVERILTGLRNNSLRMARRNVAIGEQMRRFLIRQGADQRSTVVIHNWCDDEVIVPTRHEDNPLRA
jgi:hypothetical protein